VESSVKATILKVEGNTIQRIDGLAEPSTSDLKIGEQIQFVRIGYVKKDQENTYIYTHD
jgi:glutamyl-tRNA synthetase